jgi:hypothetical protein
MTNDKVDECKIRENRGKRRDDWQNMNKRETDEKSEQQSVNTCYG